VIDRGSYWGEVAHEDFDPTCRAGARRRVDVRSAERRGAVSPAKPAAAPNVLLAQYGGYGGGYEPREDYRERREYRDDRREYRDDRRQWRDGDRDE
jgi:hypothetical protein